MSRGDVGGMGELVGRKMPQHRHKVVARYQWWVDEPEWGATPNVQSISKRGPMWRGQHSVL